MTPDIRHLAVLARLDITDEEIAGFASQLARILDYAAVVAEVATEGVEPMAQAAAGDDPPRWRDDVARTVVEPGALLEGAPNATASAGLFRVPKVL